MDHGLPKGERKWFFRSIHLFVSYVNSFLVAMFWSDKKDEVFIFGGVESIPLHN
jgi:hypothetical protein